VNRPERYILFAGKVAGKETVRGMMYNTKQEGNEMKEKEIPSEQLLN